MRSTLKRIRYRSLNDKMPLVSVRDPATIETDLEVSFACELRH
jgi:hypothetical protein